MKVLISCEFSGIVREAFKAQGHDAWSCDLEPTEIPGQHIQGDVLEVLNQGWDLMIAHPPCTYLSAAGLHYCKNNPERVEKREQAKAFVQRLFESDIPRIAIENPVGYLSTAWQKPTQVVYINDFEHPEARKPTCLWLKGLPKLIPPNPQPHRKNPKSKRLSEWYSKTRCSKLRSKTFPGFAEALAEQWGPKV